MAGQNFGTMSLHAREGGRKYLNAAERQRFLTASEFASPRVRLFCGVLFWSGSRISETLALTANGIDVDDCVASFETLKRRRKGIVRQVPLPAELVANLDREFHLRVLQRDSNLAGERLWPWSRTTAWRHVKRVMSLADVSQSAAMPKGLRHAFGVAAFQSSIPPHLVQRWLGHASLETTSIYADVAGKEERQFASRMWRDRKPSRCAILVARRR
jgi:integrase/recombinase XerD